MGDAEYRSGLPAFLGTIPLPPAHMAGKSGMVSVAGQRPRATGTFEREGERYRFKRWSDDSRHRERVVTLPNDGLNVRARYARAP